MIEQVFVLMVVCAALLGLAGVMWQIRKDQVLASSRVTFTSSRLSREVLEELFVKYVARGGHDRWAVSGGQIVSQPNHLRWTLAFNFSTSTDELGDPVLVAWTHHERVYWLPFPQRFPLWQAVDRWYEIATRTRNLIRAVRRADPQVEVGVAPAVFQ